MSKSVLTIWQYKKERKKMALSIMHLKNALVFGSAYYLPMAVKQSTGNTLA